MSKIVAPTLNKQIENDIKKCETNLLSSPEHQHRFWNGFKSSLLNIQSYVLEYQKLKQEQDSKEHS